MKLALKINEFSDFVLPLFMFQTYVARVYARVWRYYINYDTRFLPKTLIIALNTHFLPKIAVNLLYRYMNIVSILKSLKVRYTVSKQVPNIYDKYFESCSFDDLICNFLFCFKIVSNLNRCNGHLMTSK